MTRVVMTRIRVNKTPVSKQTFAIGDIHGCWKHLEKLLTFIDYNPNTVRLIFLGDYIDRGENPKKVMDIVMDLQEENPDIICLMGNHEDMALSAIQEDGRHGKSLWLSNGAETTLASLGLSMYASLDQIPEKYLNFLKSLDVVFIDEPLKFVFAHAGIDPKKSIYEQDTEDDSRGPMWIRNTFYYNPDPAPGYTIVFAHTPVFKVKSKLNTVFWGKNKAGIDTGIVYNNRLTALEIIPGNKMKAYYVDKDFNTSIELQP